jgi:hypothetical protein
MTDTPAPADGNRWRGYKHKDLYLMLHDGPGAAASAEPSRRWGEISATLTEIGQDLQKALDQTGSGWTGRAAGAAYDRLSTAVTWANASGVSAGTLRTSVEDQADHIAKARADMPKPEDVPAAQPDPTVAPAVQIIQAQTDAEPAEAAASSAEERAVEVMTAYETNTNATTGALPKFDVPAQIVPTTNMHQNQGGGLLGLATTVVSGLVGGVGSRQEDRRPDPRINQHGVPSTTSGAAATWNDTAARRPLGPPPVAPGKITGVSTDPFFAPGFSGGRSEERAASRSGTGGSGGGGNTPAPGSKSGAGMPANEFQQAQQAAAASQAAAGAHPGAGAPIAPGGGPVGGAHQDKMAMRRFGMDAIGSSQWFGDNEDAVPGEAPKRRFDLRDSTETNESATILDDESQLPPNVIGDGGR